MKTLRALALSLIVCSLAVAQSAALMPTPKAQFLDANGYPLSGGLIYTCSAGSSCPGTPLATYTDSTGSTPNANPVVLDAGGFANIWLGTSAYKIVVETSAGVVVSSTDGVSGANGIASAVGAVVKAPAGNASQSISGPLSVGSYGLTAGSATVAGTIAGGAGAFAGPLISCVENGMYVAGSSCYANIAAALTAAGSAGWVLIPKSYAGTDTYTTTYKNIVDQRGSFFGVYQYIAPSKPITGYPLGGDLALDTEGPADMVIAHDDFGGAKQTTVTTITAGAPQNITLGSTSAFSIAAAYVWAGRGQANEETCTLNSIVNTTTLNITCAQSHSGTTDIEQLGGINFKGGSSIQFNASQPSQLAGHNIGLRIGTANAMLFNWPNSTSDPFPWGAIQVGAVLTGETSHAPPNTAADLSTQNASSSNCFKNLTSTGVLGASFCDDGFRFYGAAGTAYVKIVAPTVGGQTLTLPNVNSQSVISGATSVSGAGTSDTYTVNGLTAASRCVLTAANAAAATNVAGTYIFSTATNAITVNHASVANQVWYYVCTAN